MRGFSDCCHYAEGYDDGYDDGKTAAGDLSGVLRVLARERYVAGDPESAALIDEFADEIERDPSFEYRIDGEKKRRDQQALLYAEARKAAA